MAHSEQSSGGHAVETGVYTLTPTHCGTGQAAGAVDLPIARERHTDHPLLPATALKGVARDLAARAGQGGGGAMDEKTIEQLFGPKPPQPGEDAASLSSGSLVFTDGHLLAFPVRSLQAAFYWVTCPLVVGRWRRARQVAGLRVDDRAEVPSDRPCATFGVSEPLVLEDQLVTPDGIDGEHAGLKQVAKAWAALLPAGETALADDLLARLICVADEDFGDLVRRTTPVSARVQLTPGKTTDTWVDPTDQQRYRGNLWYEETLPSDCLLSALVMTRPEQRDQAGVHGAAGAMGAVLGGRRAVQIGGNETVGQGICWWTAEGGGRGGGASRGGAS